MKKLLYLCLCLLFFSCERDTQRYSNIDVADISLSSNSNQYDLWLTLHDIYFIFFSGGINEAELESEVQIICTEYGFPVNYEDSCEVSILCQEYSEQIQGATLVPINDLLIMVNDTNLTNEEKMVLCIEAAAINYLNQYIDVLFVAETNTGEFIIERNPSSYIRENNLSISPYTIIYQPYDAGCISILNFSNDSTFWTYAENNYYANEETEDDCFETYKDNIEQATNNLQRNIAISVLLNINNPSRLATELAVFLIIYEVEKYTYREELEDCLTSIEKVIFFKP